MLPLQTTAPDFNLPNTNGEIISLKTLKNSKAYIIAFICVHCPYVKHLEKEFAALASEYKKKDVTTIAINSNDPDYDPDDSIEGMRQQASDHNFTFSYLTDETQEIAKAYQAACTPDFYVFNKHKKLVYRGQFDDSRPGQGEATGKNLKAALDSVLNNQPVPENQKPSSGCSIKWK
jgi:peroxiredoxin